jgi:hypothetical protein
MTYRTGALIDAAFAEFGGTIEGNRKAAEEFSVECSACKVFSTEAEAAIIDDAIQVYGGYGFTEEFPIARHYRDARVSRIYEGTNEINRLFMADRLMRRTASHSAAGDSYASELAGKAIATTPSHQIPIGASSDLLTLSYAEQSARLRASQVGGIASEAYALLSNWIDVRAAEAYAIATGDAISLPQPKRVEWEALASAAYDRRGPL